MSIVNGMNVYIAEHIANLGTNTFVLHQFQWAQGFDSFLKARRRNKPIRMEDYEYLRDNLQGYQQIGAMASFSPNPAGALQEPRRSTRSQLNGMTPSFVDIGREKVETGRYINDVRLPAQRARLRDRAGPGGQAVPQRRSARQGSVAGRPALPRDRRHRAAGQHLRTKPGQLRHRSAHHVSQHLDGRGRNCWSSSRRRTAGTCWNCRTKCAP